MQQKKVPMRTCVVTHEKYPKKELVRIVRTPEREVVIDKSESGKLNGRGAYIKNELSVIEQARKTKVLNHHLEIEVPSSIYDELLSELNSDN